MENKEEKISKDEMLSFVIKTLQDFKKGTILFDSGKIQIYNDGIYPVINVYNSGERKIPGTASGRAHVNIGNLNVEITSEDFKDLYDKCMEVKNGSNDRIISFIKRELSCSPEYVCKNIFYDKIKKYIEEQIRNFEGVKSVDKVIDANSLNDNVFSICTSDVNGNLTKSVKVTIEKI